MKLKIRFFLTFSLLAVIPLALLTAIAYLQYYRVTEERMSDIISSQFETFRRKRWIPMILPYRPWGFSPFISGSDIDI